MNQFLNSFFWGNTVYDYLNCFLIIVLALLIINLFKYFAFRRFKKIAAKTQTKIDDYIISAFEKFGIPLIYLLVVYFGSSYLKVQPGIKKIIDSVAIVIITFFAINLLVSLINYSIKFYWGKRTDNNGGDASIRGLSTFISLFVWSLGVIFLLDNLGFSISAIIAGLGIGGIAIALAAQTVLGDLFNYFVIFFDKPFQIGDFISVENKMGTVERIGIKTTRISSITGEQIIFHNSDLTNSRVHNYKRLERRRVVFKVQVVNDTSIEKLKEIPQIIKSIIEKIEGVSFDRAHFFTIGDFSLNYEIVYYVDSPDYLRYMDIQQEINFRILEEFQKLEIKLAFPIQTSFLNKAST
ncbi:MAG: mechanosensitive ion channel [Ignavibacteriales bacterium]|nr:mechanosensitive ion channel [Ignavibacteriales bacterium]